MARLNEAAEWGPEEEAALRAAWVTEPPKLTGLVVVADYDPAWPALFEREANRLRGLLGAEILLLQHVGSTSVPGLAAKPVIDILLVVPDPADESRYLPPLEQAGYQLVIRDPAWHEHRALKGPDTNINLHVHGPASPEIERHLRFRDHLRADRADRELYQRTKRELATRDWTYIQQYADAKSEVVEEILRRC